ncbi:MAG: hypothetical protein ACKO3W_12395 [bacterium]
MVLLNHMGFLSHMSFLNHMGFRNHTGFIKHTRSMKPQSAPRPCSARANMLVSMAFPRARDRKAEIRTHQTDRLVYPPTGAPSDETPNSDVVIAIV